MGTLIKLYRNDYSFLTKKNNPIKQIQKKKTKMSENKQREKKEKTRKTKKQIDKKNRKA